jgi:hypothetical protein
MQTLQPPLKTTSRHVPKDVPEVDVRRGHLEVAHQALRSRRWSVDLREASESLAVRHDHGRRGGLRLHDELARKNACFECERRECRV